MKKSIHVVTMSGIGDSIFQRALIKYLAKDNIIYLSTVLPDMYSDIPNVEFIKTKTSLRTQNKVIHSPNIKFVDLPKDIKTYSPFYSGEHLIQGNLISSLMQQLHIPLDTKLEWDLPDFSEHLKDFKIPDKKFAIVRPSTIRKEWPVYSRGADPSYLLWCSKTLMDFGYHVISIADLEKDVEWLDGNIDVYAHEKYYKGELGIYQIMELMKRASIVVSGVGFCVPAAVCAKTNLFTIFGGRMAYDNPSKIFHPTMDLSRVFWATPDKPCRCTLDDHHCNKRIENLDSDFMKFLSKI